MVEGETAELPLAQPAPVEPEPAPVPAPAPAPAPLAVVRPFVLPFDELRDIASGAGLEWVNSDDEKVRAAQEAIAAEPAPARVPREPKPVVALDEGPLVLVETRKDLSQFSLPLEGGHSDTSRPRI